jgi:putative toxin-antitoxin system antitoxin component (TIGR02293 family)
MEVLHAASILGGKKAPQVVSVASRMDLMELGERGVTKDALLRLARYLDFTMSQMAEVLPVTERTIQRYSLKRRFNKVVSEHILKIAEVAARGSEVFGAREKFLSWLKSPSPALGKRTPASLLGSGFGTEMLLDELGRIEHGIVS